MAKALNRDSTNTVNGANVAQAAVLARRAKVTPTEKNTEPSKKKSVSIRFNEDTRNKIAGTFQNAAGVNFSQALTDSALFVCRLYEQGRVNITKDGITLK